jgi:hypothetical protein
MSILHDFTPLPQIALSILRLMVKLFHDTLAYLQTARKHHSTPRGFIRGPGTECSKSVPKRELFASASFLSVRKRSAKGKTSSIEFKGRGQDAKMDWMTFELSGRT